METLALIAEVMEYLPLPARMTARGVSHSWRKAVDESPHLWRSWLFDYTDDADIYGPVYIDGCPVHVQSRDLVLSPSILEKLFYARSAELCELDPLDPRQKEEKESVSSELLRSMSMVEKVILEYDHVSSISHVSALTLTSIIVHNDDDFSALLNSSPPWLQHVAPDESPQTVLDFLSLGQPLTTLGWLQVGDKSDSFDIPHSVEVCGFMQGNLMCSEVKRIFNSVSGTNVTVLAISTDSGVYEKSDWADIFSMLPCQVEHLFLEFDSCYEYDDRVTCNSKTRLVCDSKFLARLRSAIHTDTKVHLLKSAGLNNYMSLHGSLNLLCPQSYNSAFFASS
jgi:hypothetical protein